MYRPNRVLATLAVGLALLVLPVSAQSPVHLKLATFAPANTTWHRALLEMRSSLSKASSGRIDMKVFESGTQGPEATVVTLMRVGQLNAALLMPAGLSRIDESVSVFGLPFFLRDDAELDHLIEVVGPVVADRLERKGFHLLNWGTAGWVEVFSKERISTLADLKRARLFTTEGAGDMVRWYGEHGFHPQALPETEIVTQLRLPRGMIDAVPSPPYGALALQFYQATPFMLDLHVAPLVGATVVTTAAWDRMSAEDRATLTSAAATMQTRVMTDVRRLDADSIAAMKKAGLTVVPLDDAARAEFARAATELVPTLRGVIVPGDIFDMAVAARDEFRRTHGQ